MAFVVIDQLWSPFDENKLNQFKKPQLIELVIELQRDKEVLKTQQDSQSILVERITELERSHFLYEQYGRRECIEITGIPTDIAQEDLEEQVIKIYNEAKVEVHGREFNRFDISACHKLGKKSVTIVKFVNRKFAYAGLSKGKNLK